MVIEKVIYWIAWLFVPVFFKLFFRLKISGKENIPVRGPAIVAANHCSYLDPPVLGVAFAPWQLTYLAKKELFLIPGFGWLIKNLGAIPIVRETPTPGTFKTILSALKKGKFVLVFPEGTRSKDGNLQSGQPGIGFIVYQAKVPVLPVLVKGTQRALPKGAHFPGCTRISVKIGQPIVFASRQSPATLKGSHYNVGYTSREAYQNISNKIMEAIKNLA